MLVGIQDPLYRRKDPVTDIYRQILDANNIKYVDVNINKPEFWEQVKTLDAFIYRWANSEYYQQIAHALFPVVEDGYKVKCFPNYATCWHYDDKLKQSLMLKAHNFPTCEAFVSWNLKEALEWAETAELPQVFKLKAGSGSMNVKLVRTRGQLIKLTKQMFNSGINPEKRDFLHTIKTFNFDPVIIFRFYAIKFRNRYIRREDYMWSKERNYVYFQKFMPNNEYDTRVQITGDRAYAFIRYNRPNDFRASGSNNWSLDKDKIDMEFVKVAFEVSKYFGFQSMAYDFVYDENRKPAIVEISYCFGDYPEFSTGYWDPNLVWHDGRFMPQYFELVDLLNMPELKLPDSILPVSSYKKLM